MPATRSHYGWTGFLGALSLASIIYTYQGGEISNPLVEERDVESQQVIDELAADMARLMSSISNWSSFCEDPYAYIRSAAVHGNFQLSLLHDDEASDQLSLSQIERDALARCSYTQSHPQGAQFRLCLKVTEVNGAKGSPKWFDKGRLFEMSVQFREHGSKLLTVCSALHRKNVEVQAYFSVYTADGEAMKIKRVSGGLRLPLESGAKIAL